MVERRREPRRKAPVDEIGRELGVELLVQRFDADALARAVDARKQRRPRRGRRAPLLPARRQRVGVRGEMEGVVPIGGVACSDLTDLLWAPAQGELLEAGARALRREVDRRLLVPPGLLR